MSDKELPPAVESVSAEIAKFAQAAPEAANRVLAPTMGSVLPEELYRGLSEHTFTLAEKTALAELQNIPDDAVEIREDGKGFIYVAHEFLRAKLTEIFGPGAWGVRPVSDAAFEPDSEGSGWLYQAWALYIHGKHVGQTVGASRYTPKNKQTSKADALKITESDALSRIVTTSSLQIGANVRDKRFQLAWRRKYAIQVWVKRFSGNQRLWRRADADPFEEEIGPANEAKHTSSQGQHSAESAAGVASSGHASPTGRSGDVRESDRFRSESPALQVQPASDPAAPKPQAAPKNPPPKPPVEAPPATAPDPQPQPEGPMATDANFRWLMAQCRRANLVAGENNAAEAVAMVCAALDTVVPAACAGKTTVEILRSIVLKTTMAQFQSAIVPAMREAVAKSKEVKP